MARPISAATTEESTPPLAKQATRRSPTVSRMEARASSMKVRGVQLPSQPQMLNTKFSRISRPWTVCTTSGWNCTP